MTKHDMEDSKTIQPRVLAKSRLFGLTGLIGAGIFFFAITTLHIVRPDISPTYDFVSNYANGLYNWLFSFPAFIHGITNIGIAAGLSIIIRGSTLTRRGIMLFIISSLAMLLAVIFPIDPIGLARTVQGTIHLFATISGFVAELIALIYLGIGLFAEPGWNTYARLTLTFAFFAVGSLAWFLISVLSNGGFSGLAERFALGVFLMWEISTAYLLTQKYNFVTKAATRAVNKKHQG